ncbi:MAG TPA: nuclear transport factor 2 family protein [Terracidiphilus sp.]|nr:nuclear transport factor 2 family protein [Terracidiphilus sp.]
MPNQDATEQELLREAYRDFNARRIDAVLARMHPAVEWANGMEGGHVHGIDEVRAYWTRQWGMIDPHVEPLRIELDQAGRFVVEVHQTVRDLNGNLLVDTVVHHAYRIRDALIERMDIE